MGMTAEFINDITAAEAKAASIKENALARAEEIISDAAKRAAMIERTSEEVCKAYRDAQTRAAAADAEKTYMQTIEQERANAERLADEAIDSSEVSVGKIIGRIIL